MQLPLQRERVNAGWPLSATTPLLQGVVRSSHLGIFSPLRQVRFRHELPRAFGASNPARCAFLHTVMLFACMLLLHLRQQSATATHACLCSPICRHFQAIAPAGGIPWASRIPSSSGRPQGAHHSGKLDLRGAALQCSCSSSRCRWLRRQHELRLHRAGVIEAALATQACGLASQHRALEGRRSSCSSRRRWLASGRSLVHSQLQLQTRSQHPHRIRCTRAQLLGGSATCATHPRVSRSDAADVAK